MNTFGSKLFSFILFLSTTLISYNSDKIIPFPLTVSSVLLGMSIYALFTDKLLKPPPRNNRFWKFFSLEKRQRDI